jgi:predicted DNA-binding ribbon-helix-helix protein
MSARRRGNVAVAKDDDPVNFLQALIAERREPRQTRAMPGLRKRSVLLSGHATSIALEPEFWAVLDDMASAEGVSLAALIGRIDDERAGSGLASACRLAALKFVQARHPGPGA